LSKKVDLIFPLFCGLLAYIVYELTNAQGLFWGDGGEFIAASSTLGIGHAYGHPLFWLVGRISIMLNPSNPAAAMNHLVALFSAGSCFVITLLAQNWVNDKFSRIQKMIAVFTAVGIYAVAPTVWSQASYVEVYNFQAFFLALAVYFLDRYFFRKGNNLNLFASAYFFGIAVTLGLYVLLLAILPLSMWLVIKRKIRLSAVFVLIFFFVLGITPWLYLVIRPTVHPILTVERINSFSALLSYLGRKSYSVSEKAGMVAIPFSFLRTFKIFLQNLSPWGFILFGFSFWGIFSDKNYRKALSYLITLFLFVLFFGVLIPLTLTFVQMIEMDTYFIPALILSIPLLVIGINKLIEILRPSLQPLLILPIVIIVWGRWSAMDISDDRLTEKFTEYMVSNLPAKAKLVTVSDEVTYPLYYYIYALGNQKNFTFLTKTSKDTAKTWWKKYLQNSGVFIQIDTRFTDNITDFSKYPIAGPFFTSVYDSSAAKKLESEFNNNFPVKDIEKRYRFHREDSFFMGSILGRRGLYWFQTFTHGNLRKEKTQTAYKKANLSFYKAFFLNRSNLSGAEHGSMLAFSLINSKKFEEAKNYANQALKINPYTSAPYKALYAISMETKDYKHALLYARKIIKLISKNGEAHLDLANLYQLLNQPEKAKEEYNKGIKLGAKPRKELEDLLFPIEESSQ